MITFKKILSTIGIGSAKVHTVILQRSVQPGQTLRGEVHVYGGDVEQEIHNIDIEVFFESYKDEEDSENHYFDFTLGNFQIQCTEPIRIQEEKIFPFEIDIPLRAPLSNANQVISLKTRVNIPMAPDPVEIQSLNIEDPIVEACFNTFAQNGCLFAVGSGIGRYKANQENEAEYEQSFILHKWIGNRMLEWTVHFNFNEEVVVLQIQEDPLSFSFTRNDENELKKELKELERWIQSAK